MCECMSVRGTGSRGDLMKDLKRQKHEHGYVKGDCFM